MLLVVGRLVAVDHRARDFLSIVLGSALQLEGEVPGQYQVQVNRAVRWAVSRGVSRAANHPSRLKPRPDQLADQHTGNH